MNLSPIALFVYNRPWHTKQTIEALKENELASESELFIFADAPKNKGAEEKVKEVREYIKTINGFKKITIIEREKNFGLANNIIDGVTKVINEYGKIIVLEDDLVTSPYFLKFMNDALEFYKDEEKVFTVSGFNNIVLPENYNEEVFFAYISSSWGWGTWIKEWNTIVWDNNYYYKFLKNKKLYDDILSKVGRNRIEMLKDQLKGRINSWAIRRLMFQVEFDKLTVFPDKTYVKNIGFDGSGVHCGKRCNFVFQELNYKPISKFIPPKVDERIINSIVKKNKVNVLNIFKKNLKFLLKDIINGN